MASPMATKRSTVEMERPMKFRGTGYSGSVVTMHVPGEGEAREGPGPMELVVLAAGGCTASDVVDILRKQRASLEAFRIEIESERAKGPPAVLTRVHLKYVFRGDLKEDKVKRAIALSQEKYCSVSIMLKRAGVDVTTSYDIERPRP